jgi:hypothetical protein
MSRTAASATGLLRWTRDHDIHAGLKLADCLAHGKRRRHLLVEARADIHLSAVDFAAGLVAQRFKLVV